jgi:hypothetical protein
VTVSLVPVFAMQYLTRDQQASDVLVRLRSRGSSSSISVKLEGEKNTIWYWSTKPPRDSNGASLKANVWYKLAGILTHVSQVRTYTCFQ